jgi:hypothetical protein
MKSLSGIYFYFDMGNGAIEKSWFEKPIWRNN